MAPPPPSAFKDGDDSSKSRRGSVSMKEIDLLNDPDLAYASTPNLSGVTTPAHVHHKHHHHNSSEGASTTALNSMSNTNINHRDVSLLIDGNGDDDPKVPMTKIVAHVGFAEAIVAQQPKKWTRAMFKLYFFLTVAFLNSLINSYNTSLIGVTNAQKDYQDYFNLTKEISGSEVALLMSCYTVGNIVGSFFCGPFTDWWGRRWGMFSGAVVLIVGSFVQGSATSRTMFITGRFLLGGGIALSNTAAPCYVAEMAHPAWRGPLTGLYNSLWGFGALPATFVPYMVENLPPSLTWRMPIWFQALGASLLLVLSLFIPESPRWLFANDKKEEAVRVLEKYHGEGSRRSPIVVLTYREMVQEVFIEGSDKRWWDYSDLYSTKAAWWRNACVIGLAFTSQWSGNAVVTYFQPMLFKQAGIDGDNLLAGGGFLIATMTILAASITGSISGALFVEKIGRRRVLLTGNSLMIVWWAVIAMLCYWYAQEGNTNVNGARAAIAFINIFCLTYSFCYTPLQILYPVECLSYEVRAKGMGVYNLAANTAGFFNTYGITNIMKHIEAKWYFFYVPWNLVQVAWIYYFFVETRGRSLEEINEIWKAPYPKAKSIEEHQLVLSEEILRRSWELEDLNELHED